MRSSTRFKAMNVIHRILLSASGGRLGWTAEGMPVLELTTTGRKSGQPHSVMLTSPLQEGAAIIVVASGGGDRTPPAWFLNVRDSPAVGVRLQGNPKRQMPLLPIGAAILLAAASRPADIPFRIRMIDPGANETVAVADLNNDGRPDINSGESWYEAPAWTKHPLRAIGFNSNYIDNFTDIAIDVDGDGWIDIVQFGYFSSKIVWLKNPGKRGGAWAVNEIDASGPTEFAFLVDLNNDGKAQELLQIGRAHV